MNRALIAIIGACYVAVAAYKLFRYQRHDAMSFNWLNEQERDAIRRSAAIDGPAWKWPVDKQERAS